MPAAFPHEYTAELTWIKGRRASLNAADQPPIVGGPPPQFDGSSEDWSPEELLLSSIQLCLMTTFLSLQTKSDIQLDGYTSSIRGILEKTKDGLRFTSIRLSVELRASDGDKAIELLTKAKKYCIISNALNVPIELDAKTAVEQA